MKTAVATVVAVVVVLAHVAGGGARNHSHRQARQHGEFECLDSADCGTAGCCVVSPMRYSYPACSAHGQKGATCRPTAQPYNTSLAYPDGAVAHVTNAHYIMCPCAAGLECNVGTCQEPLSAQDNSLEQE